MTTPDINRLSAMLSFCYTCVAEKHNLNYTITCKPKEGNNDPEHGNETRIGRNAV